MGFFDSISEALSDAVKDPQSTPETFLDYWYDAGGQISLDAEYIELFGKAVRYLANKRPQDEHLQSIMNRTGGQAYSAVEIRNEGEPTEHFSVWRVYFGSNESESLSIKLRFHSSNACQKNRSGEIIRPGSAYRVFRDYETWRKAEEAKVQEEAARKKELERRKATEIADRQLRPAIDSFLGAKFGDPVSQYAVAEAPEIDFETGLVAVAAKLNRFLNFNSTFVFRAFDENTVIGVFCISEDMEEHRLKEEMSQIVSVFAEKYHRECKCIDDGAYKMVFYRDEVNCQEEYAAILVAPFDESKLMIHMLCSDIFEPAGRRYEMLKKAKKDETAALLRKSAIDAL